MKKIVLLSAFVLIFIGAQNSFADKISIESRVADGSWRSISAIEPLIGQAVSLRVKKIHGAAIRWFQIVPDIDIRYNNAVWPWLPNAYKWKGYDGNGILDEEDLILHAGPDPLHFSMLRSGVFDGTVVILRSS